MTPPTPTHERRQYPCDTQVEI